jgi:integrase
MASNSVENENVENDTKRNDGERLNLTNSMLHYINKPHITSTVNRLDERKINAVFDNLPKDLLKNVIRRRLPRIDVKRRNVQSNDNIPLHLKKAITSLGLLDEDDYERRAQTFIGYCRFRNYSYNTTIKYFRILHNTGIFGKFKLVTDPKTNEITFIESKANSIINDDNDITDEYINNDLDSRPDRLVFNHCGKQHIRIVGKEDFLKFSALLQERFSIYTAPILIAFYTGLRTSEILQFTTFTIYQLLSKHHTTTILRKMIVIKNANMKDSAYDNDVNSDADDVDNNRDNRNFWTPIYNTHLNDFIVKLRELYANDYKTFLEAKINTKLFNVTPKTLGNRIKSLYYEATGKLAPYGFGIHSCRNMISIIMAEKSNNLTAIQRFLQHKNIKTTRRYVKADFSYTITEFNRLTNQQFSNIRAILNEGIDVNEKT